MTNYSIDLESGSSQYLSITDAAQTGLDLTGDCTLEFWAKIETQLATNGTYSLLSKWQNTGQFAYEFQYRDESGTKYLNLWLSSNGTNNENIKKSITALTVGAWTHIAIVFTAASSQIEVYINGVSQGTATGTFTSIYNGTDPVGIGQGSYYDGLMFDMRVWNDVRTAAEIRANMNRHVMPDAANLQANWKFNNDYLDATTNDNDLTANGSPVFSTDVPWKRLESPEATGGTITYSGPYKIHTFTSSGTLEVQSEGHADILVVAGGGGGGGSNFNAYGSGGGGGGGLAYQTDRLLTVGSKTVTIGAGGAGGADTGANGANGNNSVFDTITATGGGGGGKGGPTNPNNGLAGGSAGGGSGNSGSGGTANQDDSGGATGFGRNGGNGGTDAAQQYGGGGGGGAGAVGAAPTGTNPNDTGGAGGDGKAYDISGTSTYYGGGGGGSGSIAGPGGQGGGGDGDDSGGPEAENGTANTGGGGGGGYYDVTGHAGGNGGSGIVIVRYLVTPKHGFVNSQDPGVM